MSFDKTIHLPVNADEAFALVTEPERLRRWLTVAARVDLRVGGEYRWTVNPGNNAVGIFQEIEAGKRVVFTWGWESGMEPGPGASTVTITLEPDDGGTALRLVHEGLPAEQIAGHAEGWDHYLTRLVAEASAASGAGLDEWAAVPDPINHFSCADASLAVLLDVLRKLTPEDLEKATPCEEFNIQELLDHLAGSLIKIGGALGARLTDQTEAAPEVRIAGLAQPTLEAFTRRGIDGTIDMGFAELPATIVAGILNLELLVHAWDFAKATDQELAVSDVVTDYVASLARLTITDQVRASGSFASAQPVAETAGSLDRLIGFTGRTVAA